MRKAKTIIEVVELETGKVVHRVETDMTGSQLEKVEMGMLRQMDLEKYGTRLKLVKM
jgi:hypothetical protein